MKKVMKQMLRKAICLCKKNKITILLGYIAVIVTANSIDNSNIIKDLSIVDYEVNSLCTRLDEVQQAVNDVQYSIYDIKSPNKQTTQQIYPPVLGNQTTLDDECTD